MVDAVVLVDVANRLDLVVSKGLECCFEEV